MVNSAGPNEVVEGLCINDFQLNLFLWVGEMGAIGVGVATHREKVMNPIGHDRRVWIK